MKQTAINTKAPQDLEPAADVKPLDLPKRLNSKGVRLNIRGRSMRMHRLRRPAAGPLRWLLILGPGLIASSAGNDAGGIATYSSVGAKYGYKLIWVTGPRSKRQPTRRVRSHRWRARHQ